MDDFRRKPVNRAARPQATPPSTRPQTAVKPQQINVPHTTITAQPIASSTGITPPVRKVTKKKLALVIMGSILLVLVAAAGTIALWYTSQLAPVDKNNTELQVVEVKSGTTPSGIATLLKKEGLIRDETAFLWHARLKGVQNLLQAGTYRLSPSESTPEIVKHLSSGKVDTFSITFLPGATVADNKKVFLKAGYEQAEIDAAFATSYTSPLFEGKPDTADLEGYIYGETYTFGTNTSVEAVLEHAFEHYYEIIVKYSLVSAFQARGLTLYEGITMASIIQREAGSIEKDMPQIAQVFYTRLAKGMVLGSDVTYQYAADKMGVARDTNLNSPYNTRRYAGLPPGPIATPGVKALQAAANPAPGDFLFFLSGDDDVTYFARTDAEHEANIRNHCKEKCQII